ncbi:MAG: CoB--CoM heterodisulfide reductase iron-sulfur subunit A family protein [Chloroflexi bacterium]|nr:CoB--CoM heterodisulfide reductase iron-sulfur subunit A family protein [Chloroflexota bacterium]MCL5108992.1 CoB--CoM heterodisulfide reductase iron-sulfur subunit A family protein [Chloroflexota bacterium]
MARVGVFICHCGSNIAGVVDCAAVASAARRMPGVVHAEENNYACSEVGQAAIRTAIKEHRLNRVVVASCSPRMHEPTFRRTVAMAGLNRYLMEMANIREHVSWVHGDDKPAATGKAIDSVRMAVAKVIRDERLTPGKVGITKRALVIGGGIAGIQAALDIANAGHEVILVEREPTIGGRMAQLDKTFPTLDCSACILTPRMVEVGQHPKIRLATTAQVEKVSGFVGNFEVTIRHRAKRVDHSVCTGCGTCWQKCPEKVPSEFDSGLGKRTCIYIPFPQAVPNKPVIDWANCRYQRYLAASGAEKKPPQCRICEKLCPAGAIRFQDEDSVVTEQVGAIVVSTGFQAFDHSAYPEYGGGRYKDVISCLQLERLLCASGPTGGEVVRPSDGKHPKTVVFVSCVGSRDDRVGRPYCSKVCCMYMAKQTILLKEHDPEVQAYVFYIDIRAGGKDFEEFVRRSQEEYGALWLRGRVAKVYEEDGKLIVRGEDSLVGRPVEVAADLVVLATGIEPSAGADALARTLGVSYNDYGFIVEAHPKLRPLESNTDGIFLAGTVSGPRDIPETVAQGSGAAAKVIGLLNQDELVTDPMVSRVDPLRCSGCLSCREVCPFDAIGSELLRDGRTAAKVNESSCKGCGLCVVTCRSGAMNLRGFTDQQLLAEVVAITR